MSHYPVQGALGLVIMIVGTWFGVMAWSRERNRLGPPVAIIGGSLLIGGWVAKPSIFSGLPQKLFDSVSWVADSDADVPAPPATTTAPVSSTTTAVPSSANPVDAPTNSSSTQIDWDLVGAVVLVVFGVAIAACLIGVVVVIVRGRLHRRRSDRQAEQDRRTALHGKWEQARSVLGGVREQRNNYLLDAADRLFTRPLLDDTSEPLTAAFVEAFEAADKPGSTTKRVHTTSR